MLLTSRAALGALFLASLSACAHYAGPPSAHFDGARFHDDPDVSQPGFWDVVAWEFTRDPIPWPDWVDIPPASPPPARVSGTVRVTFVNHSTLLVQAGGVNLLTDPVWSRSVGPTSWLGPVRRHAPGIRFEDLPHIDVILLSHDHYDHMDLPTLERLRARDAPLVLSGLGNAPILEDNGIRPHEELDWWDCRTVGAARICAVPAQHNSRRGVFDGERTLWVGYFVDTPDGSLYFAGDTGFGPQFARIRARMGPPCISLLPIGAYAPRWMMRENHIDPDEAVRANDILGSELAIAMHMGTLQQSDEGMYEPAGELGLALRDGHHAPFLVPKPGEAIEHRCGKPGRASP